MGTMDKSARFFAKLKSLAVRLDTERANLEQTASQKLNEEDDETDSGAVQTLHELHSEVRGLKKQVQGLVASQDDGDLRSFIKACMVLKQRTTEDVDIIKRHYEKYGYKPRKALQKNSELTDQAEAETRPRLQDQPERETAEEVGGDTGEEISVQMFCQESETSEKMPPPAVDPMRTPQLADFGLSALHLQRVLNNAEASREVAPPTFVSLSPPTFTYVEPQQPKTPRCSLDMDEDAPTPRLEDFGITEQTMWLNNDFTIDLFRKKPPRDRQTHRNATEVERPPETSSSPPPAVPHGKRPNESMESPELPEFCTLDLKMNKPFAPSSGLPDFPLSPPRPSNDATTPELPTFETPHINKLLSTKKATRQKSPTESLTSLSNPLECPPVSLSDMPQMPLSLYQSEEATPEMPKLQSLFGRSLPCMGGSNRSQVTLPAAPELQPSEEHTEDWCLSTPRVRIDFQTEPRTPEMPDMSSVTQDILKLVKSQGNSKSLPTSSVTHSSKPGLRTTASGKENKARVLSHVCDKEFNELASYMKQIPLISLNQAVDKINLVLKERCRDGDVNSELFHMEDLRKTLDVGPQAPVYILSLVELKRLENVQAYGRNATFKILTKT